MEGKIGVVAGLGIGMAGVLLGCDSGSAASATAVALCDKLVDCGMPSSDRGQCEAGIDAAFPYVVDADAVAACASKLPCQQLKDQPEESIKTCLDLNIGSFECRGDSLHYCNNKGTCVDLSCKEVCANVAGGTYDHCGMGDDGHEVCYCRK
jgi:hypothetical protein